MAELAEGRTTPVIANRLTTVRHADQIVVVGRNGVGEQDTHYERVAAGGVC